MVLQHLVLLRFHGLRVTPLVGERKHATSNDREHDHEVNRNSASAGGGTIAKEFHCFCSVMSPAKWTHALVGRSQSACPVF